MVRFGWFHMGLHQSSIEAIQQRDGGCWAINFVDATMVGSALIFTHALEGWFNSHSNCFFVNQCTNSSS
jgi:hypothetical protein